MTHCQYCAAVNCSNSRQKCKGLSFFRFSKDVERSKRWVINTRREDLLKKSASELNRSFVLCADHFEDEQFMNAVEKKRLVWNAVPTIFSVPNPPKLLASKRPKPRKRYMERADLQTKSAKRIGPESLDCDTNRETPTTTGMDLQKTSCQYPKTEESQGGDHTCNECDTAFKQKLCLNGHVGILEGNRQVQANIEKYKCNKCKRHSPNTSNFKSHRRKARCQSYECLNCRLSFSHSIRLFRHICERHKKEVLQKQEFKCAKCSKWIILRWTSKIKLDEKRLLCCRCFEPPKKTVYIPANNSSVMLLGNQIHNVSSTPLYGLVNVTDSTKEGIGPGNDTPTQVAKVILPPGGKLPVLRKGANFMQVQEINTLMSSRTNFMPTAAVPDGANVFKVPSGNNDVVPAFRKGTGITLPNAGSNVDMLCKGTGLPDPTHTDFEFKTEDISTEDEVSIVKEEVVDEEFSVEQVFIKEL